VGTQVDGCIIENKENTRHLFYFGPKDNVFPHVQVSKDFNDYINTNKKYINVVFEINEAIIQKFIEAPTRNIPLIKTMFPKMDNFENKMRKSIASYKAPSNNIIFSMEMH
jgi:hypothetical protein